MSRNSTEIKVFAGSSGKSFAQKMCEYLGASLGASDTKVFSDGNIFVKIDETVRDKDVYIVQPIARDPNNELVELIFWIDAFKRSSASSVTAIIPYFGYSKGDKKDEARVSIRARVCAEMIEQAGVDRVVVMDLHSPQVQGFFKKPVDHIFGEPVLSDHVRWLGLDQNLVVVSPDAGYAKRARNFARHIRVPIAIGDKERYDHTENANIFGLIGDVAGKDALIVDDFTISGGTLVDMAKMLKKHGAKRIFACVSHMMLSEKGRMQIENSPIEFIIATDTIDNEVVRDMDKIRFVSVAPLFAETVSRIHNREAVSPLFDEITPRLIKRL